jgi:hypothetical protein
MIERDFKIMLKNIQRLTLWISKKNHHKNVSKMPFYAIQIIVYLLMLQASCKVLLLCLKSWK